MLLNCEDDSVEDLEEFMKYGYRLIVKKDIILNSETIKKQLRHPTYTLDIVRKFKTFLNSYGNQVLGNIIIHKDLKILFTRMSILYDKKIMSKLKLQQ